MWVSFRGRGTPQSTNKKVGGISRKMWDRGSVWMQGLRSGVRKERITQGRVGDYIELQKC